MAALATEPLGEADILDRAFDRALKPLGIDVGLAYRLGAATGETTSIRSVGLTGASTSALHNISDDRPARDLLRREGVGKTMSFPLRTRGKTVGAIVLGSRSRRSLRRRDIAAIELIASLLGTALDDARTRVRNRQEVAELEELARLS